MHLTSRHCSIQKTAFLFLETQFLDSKESPISIKVVLLLLFLLLADVVTFPQESPADARVTRDSAATWRMRLKFDNANFGDDSNL